MKIKRLALKDSEGANLREKLHKVCKKNKNLVGCNGSHLDTSRMYLAAMVYKKLW